jgi:hypothetical protein
LFTKKVVESTTKDRRKCWMMRGPLLLLTMHLAPCAHRSDHRSLWVSDGPCARLAEIISEARVALGLGVEVLIDLITMFV